MNKNIVVSKYFLLQISNFSYLVNIFLNNDLFQNLVEFYFLFVAIYVILTVLFYSYEADS